MAPIKRFSAGSISCALWENEVRTADGRKASILKATVERRYKDKDGTCKSSNSFSRNEIPLVQYVLGKAFEAMVEEKSDRGGSEVIEEETAESARGFDGRKRLSGGGEPF